MIDHESISFTSRRRCQVSAGARRQVNGRRRDAECGITCCAWALGRNRAACLSLRIEAADLRDIIAAAAHFCLYLDKRTGRPLINDLTFTTQLYLASLYLRAASYSADYRDRWCAHPWATNHRRFDGYWAEQVGLYPPAAVHLQPGVNGQVSCRTNQAMEASLMACPESVALVATTKPRSTLPR